MKMDEGFLHPLPNPSSTSLVRLELEEEKLRMNPLFLVYLVGALYHINLFQGRKKMDEGRGNP